MDKNQNLSTVKNIFLFLLCILFLALITLKKEYSTATTQGVILYFYSIMPSLLPYIFIIGLINGFSLTTPLNSFFSPFSNKVFNISGNAFACYLLSLLSGFPLGSKLIADLKEKGEISQSEALRASAMCSSCSPSFFIATIGGSFFSSKKIGLILFLSSTLSSIIIGFIFSFYKRKDKPKNIINLQKSVGISLYDNTYNTVISILVIGCMITVFYLISVILQSLKIIYPFTYLVNIFLKNEKLSTGLVLGLIEITSGVKIISNCGINILSICLVSFITGFTGLSGILQSTTFLKKAKIKTALFFVSKIISAVLNVIFTFVLLQIFL